MLSIRQFLLISLLITVTMITGIATWWTYKNISNEITELLDGQLLQTEKFLEDVFTSTFNQASFDSNHPEFSANTSDINHYLSLINEASPLTHDTHQIYRVFQIWHTNDTLWLKSKHAPNIPLSSTTEGFSNNYLEGNDWRVYTTLLPQYGLRIQLAQSQRARNRIIRTVAMGHIVPLLVMYPLLAGFIWLIIHQGIRRIDRIAKEVKLRKPNNLEPLDSQRAPQEIKPLLDNLNSLFKRLNQAFEYEKRFTTDAAHELRTPLAGLKIQAQVALQSTDPNTLKTALNHIKTSVDRCSHLIQQLITLNRLHSHQALPKTEYLDLTKITITAVATLVPMALAKNTEIEFESNNAEHAIWGNAELLNILIHNLIDNAVRYTPSNSLIQVTLFIRDACTHLCIVDNGPGIPKALQQRVFERFYRMLGTKTHGSGLGLSIVHQIVLLHHAKMHLSNTSPIAGGLSVEIIFPQAKI